MRKRKRCSDLKDKYKKPLNVGGHKIIVMIHMIIIKNISINQ